MTEKFLESAYELESPEATKALYEKWADSYDQELSDNGYVSPQRTALALAATAHNLDAPLLDIGCGSGVSGFFLKEAGFSHLIGSDFSAPMLELAKLKNLYQELHLADFVDPFSFINKPFELVTAVGVMAPGHAEPSLIPDVLALMSVGGLFGFSMNDHTLDNPAFMATIEKLVMDKKIRIRWQEYGDHIPKINLNSIIMIIEKTR